MTKGKAKTLKKIDKRIGNQFWRARVHSGRKPIFKTPQDLWKAAEKYFDWVEENPLYKAEPVKYQGRATLKEIPVLRALTQAGLCLFIGITQRTYIDYRNKEDFSQVVEKIDQYIRTQKFEGAAADLLNSNIIARDLGLADNQHKEITGKDGGAIQQEWKVTFIDKVEE